MLQTNELRHRLPPILQALQACSLHSRTPVTALRKKPAPYHSWGLLTEPEDAPGWTPFTPGDAIGGEEAHFCFRGPVAAPASAAGRHLVCLVSTGATDIWNNNNPQFLAYLNGELVCGLDVNHTEFDLTPCARPGDSFSRVASRSKTTIEAIKRGNRIRPEENTLFLNQKLVLYPGPWRIRVEKAARLLKLYNCNPAHPEQLFAVFDVGIGRLGKTPTANFVISGRLKHPAWYTPNGGIIPYGDPENMLGDYFLKLAPASTPGKPLLGYGIHGTPDESSVTKSLSNGCIRMRNADVELLYILVPGRTPVEITE